MKELLYFVFVLYVNINGDSDKMEIRIKWSGGVLYVFFIVYSYEYTIKYRSAQPKRSFGYRFSRSSRGLSLWSRGLRPRVRPRFSPLSPPRVPKGDESTKGRAQRVRESGFEGRNGARGLCRRVRYRLKKIIYINP